MTEEERDAMVLNNYGYWVWVVKYLRRSRAYLARTPLDELTQDALCELLEAAHHWDGVRPFKNYGYRVIANHLYNRRYWDRLIRVPRVTRKGDPCEGQRHRMLASVPAGVGAVSRVPAPKSLESREAEGRELREVVDTLPPYLAERIKDRYGLGRPATSSREIGRRDGISPNAAVDRLATALRHLRKAVAA